MQNSPVEENQIEKVTNLYSPSEKEFRQLKAWNNMQSVLSHQGPFFASWFHKHTKKYWLIGRWMAIGSKGEPNQNKINISRGGKDFLSLHVLFINLKRTVF